jgi:hypothetical protein
MKRALAAAMFALAANALASGDYGPTYTMFKAYSAPDIPLAQFQAGELGVLQPGMRRVYLYTAWRAIMLGPKVAQAPGADMGLARADGSAFANGWRSPFDDAYKELLSRGAAVMQVPVGDAAARIILACPTAANDNAIQTLHALSARPDANSERVNAWIRAQYQVGEACQQAEDSRYLFISPGRKLPVIQPPQPLPASEPLFWRQLRDYQRAAWQFYGEHFDESTALFEQIGATKGHPMQGLGRYLALRSEVRRFAAAAKGVELARREAQAHALEQRGAAILADATLAPVHEPTRGLLRSMRVALTPETRLAELDRYLDDPSADPFAQDRLGDWSVLMDRTRPQDLRAGHDFIDWIETLHECGYAQGANGSCAIAWQHALERWQRTRSRVWLVAAMMLAETSTPALMQAALAITPDDPAYVTTRYHIARLYRLDGKSGEARAVSDALLQRTLSPGTRNLFREERFAVATSVQDAGNYLLRTNVDTARRSPQGHEPEENEINDDGLAWFKSGLSVADMVELARLQSLPKPLRARIAGAAWIRAALLDKPGPGRQAAEVLAELVPALLDATQRYRHAASARERRHFVLVAAMSYGLSAELTWYYQPVQQVGDDVAAASNWCTFKPDEPARWPAGFVWRLPAMPEVGDVAARREELARLAPMKTATGLVGDDVLEWADSHPQDPALPWLLHVVVQSTRGGCLDPDAGALSRKAFALLHKRFPGSQWADNTPYYYGDLK